MLKLYNSLTLKKEKFSPIKSNKVSLYVCGITPYDTTHLGHAFTYLTFDVLVRYLRFLGYSVNYTQNVTDINDRDNDLLKRAREKNISWEKLSTFWTKIFLKDMSYLNWTMPSNFIKVSENIDLMIDLIKKLDKNGLTYTKNGNVYLDTKKVKNFGKLSRLNREEMLKKAKEFEEGVEDLGKKDPLDVRLWRATDKDDPRHIPSFESPFGQGRPGWHIECSALAIATLGPKIDIHGGGIDLMYPHHESEIVQSEGATQKSPFVKYWMHTAPVYYKKEKMSKSLGNLILVSDLLKKYSANVIRWFLLSHHYRRSWEFKEKDIKTSEKEFQSIVFFLKNNKKGFDIKPFKDFKNALDNDLDTPLALQITKKYPNSKMLLVLGFSKI